MAALINIAGATPVDDPSYRYKMPRIMGKVEGRGNGIKTLLVNIIDVAKSLNREAPEVTKYFGTELGAQTTYSGEPGNERAIVNGAHTDQTLQEKIKIYIEKFVLCATCKLPETHYKIKDGVITQKCLACGSKSLCDMGHKLTTFIVAQNKKAKADAKKGDKTDSKKDKKVKKDKAAEAGSPTNDEKEKTSSKKEKKEKKEKKSKDNKGDSIGSTDKKTFFDGQEGEPLEDETNDVEDSDEKAIEDAIVRFIHWLSTDVGDSAAQKTNEQIYEELRALQTMSSLKPADRPLIFLGAVLNENIITEKQIVKHREFLEHLASSAITQRHLIAAFEWFCGLRHDALLVKFPLILKELFDQEIVDEEQFLMWYSDYMRNEYTVCNDNLTLETLEKLRNSAAPFITWLKEAESEGDSDEEDDEDEN
jgi:translation initiation factor 5